MTRSIKTRVTLLTLAVFLLCIWALAFYASRILYHNLQSFLSDQQLSTVSLMAGQIQEELELRLRSLEDIASRITPAMMADVTSLQAFIANRSVLHALFNGGLFVTRPDGTTIADHPLSAGRIGLRHGDRGAWLSLARAGTSSIGRPITGRKTKAPIVPIAAPIRDRQGNVIGALVGVIHLGQPNFLDRLLGNRYGKTGDFTLIAPQHRLVVSATDKGRILQPAPAPGVNPLYDRFAGGFSGSGVTVDYRGVEVLASGQKVPVSGWLLVGRMPTEEVFAPIRALLGHVLLVTLLLTLLAGGLTWWLLRRQLAPLLSTAEALANLSETEVERLQPLPVARPDEVGALIGGFNTLLGRLRQREEALRLSEERYQSLFEQAGEGILILDTEGKVLSVNRAYAEMHGYTVEEMRCLRLEDMTAEGEATQARIERILAGETLAFEARHHHRNGRTFPLAVTAKLVSWRSERVVMGIHRDLTEAKRAEETARRSREETARLAGEQAALAEIGRVIGSTLEIERVYEQFGAVTRRLIPFDALNVNLIDAEGGTFTVAYYTGVAIPGLETGRQVPLAGTMTAYMLERGEGTIVNVADPEALIARHPGIPRINPVIASFPSNMLIPLISNDRMIGMIHFRKKGEGGYGEEHLRLAEQIGRQIAGAIANARLYADLEENRRANEHLAEEQTLLAEIGRITSSTLEIEEVYGSFAAAVRQRIPLDNMNIALLEPDKERLKITYVFGAAIPGRRAGETSPLQGTPSRMVLRERQGLILHAEREGDFADRFPTFRFSFQAGMRSMLCVPLIFRNEAIGTLNIRTRQPRAYSLAHLRLAEQIGRQVAGAIVNARLFAAYRQAEQERLVLMERLARAERMEALGTLAGGVAHDLNNVLGIVVGYAEMLLDSLEASSDLRSDATKIMEAGQRSAAIVQDLLTLARRGVQTKKVLQLNALVREVVAAPELEKRLALQPGVRIEADLEADLLNIQGSPVHLGKTVANLVANALEAMPGGGRVILRTANRYLDRPVQGYDTIRTGDYVVLTVSDDGEGIPPGDLQHIFEPFYTKKVMGRSGTGLGLAVVWGTVKDHQGYVDVQSEVGKGTTFSLYFPVTREALSTEEAALPPSAYAGSGERILVVDDVREQRELASRMLGRLSYRVASVASGEEAVDHLRTNEADLVVLDMIMDPGMDGLETYRAILKIRPGQRAVIVSGFSESERVHEAQALGAGAYVKKPYVLERLGLAVKRELERQG